MDAALQAVLARPERLSALAQTGLLDGDSVETLARYVRLVRNAIGAKVALVTLVDDHRQFFVEGAETLAEPWRSRRETPLSHSFCKHVVGRGTELIISDAHEEPLVADNLAIPDLGVVAYAGIPIVTGDGETLGSFCAIEDQPRQWSERELSVLRDLAQGVSEEIDARRRARRAEESERELATLNQRLEADAVHHRQTTAEAVHDIRSPLSVLALGVSQLVSHDATRNYPELSRLLGILTRSANHASSLVESMHEITRMAADADDEAVIDVAELARQVADALSTTSTIPIEVTAEGQNLVRADPTSLTRALENLMSNALRFADGRVRVALRSDADEHEVVIVVEDDGCGLPSPDAYRRVWRPNTRFHLDQGKSGSGLGLSIVREFAERRGGRTYAKPSPLGGARFCICLPHAD